MRRRKAQAETGFSSSRDVQAETGKGKETDLPDGYSYLSEDPLHGRITARLKEIVTKIFDDARQNPEGEANLMVRAMLLNQVANMQPNSYQGNVTSLLAEERRRGIEHERQVELDSHNFRILTLRAKSLAQKVKEKDQQIAKTQHELERAQDALEHGQPLDPRAVYRRISEIVGLRAPAEGAAEAPAV